MAHRILITDDNSEYRQTILELLEFEGFEVYAAQNGIETLNISHKHQIDLVICDMDMPGMTGLEVLQALKANPETSMTPFIFVTGNSDKNLILKSKKLGASDYMIKPMNIQKLLYKISQILD